ncbi:nuclear transport factor 2 family protein [Novosphingobium malaysiense]|uniref:SnoaL-like domain-containing protein n=1 Tax=Novosphingobium malaysiense TaxID=1348853 RepID=A0A0B1ZRI3_9SPHN|nr:nuclear transport factor 2 family protein [Novosphingobium malaysiense]KHK93176.1 hypothetical protein LK12_02240 [Novosphingobium malaysiense]
MSDVSMPSDLVAFVREQKDRQEIWDCLVRYARGLDRFDMELMASAYHPDAWDDHGLKSAGGGDFCEWAIGFHGQIQTRHQHFIGNHSVELEGETAHAETYYFFWGENLEGPPTLAFGRYLDRFEKRNGKWAIAYRRCITEKTGTFRDADLPDGFAEANAATGPCRRDRHDASYARPLTRETPNE